MDRFSIVTLLQTLSPTTSTSRVRAGLIVATLVLGGTLTACGGDAGDTTCGEYSDYSDSEKVDFVKDAAKDELDDDDLKALDELGDAGYETMTDIFTEACDGEDDDTKLEDLDGFS